MALVNKQDSNSTGLSYAVETSPGVVDGSVTWLPLEPNSYKNFGGEVKTKARMPINASRQLKKGVVVDLDAQGGFVQDLTADNFQDPAQCFMYASLRKKNESAVAVVDASGDTYAVASGGVLYPSDLIFAKGFTDTENNGLQVVVAGSTPLLTKVSGSLASATGQSGIISRVGYQFASSAVEIDVSGDLPILKTAASQVAASSTFTITGATNFADTETVTIGGQVYTAQTALTSGAGHFLIGADKAASLVNLARAINQSGLGGGTLYDAAATDPNEFVTATEASPMVVTARYKGTQGNSVTTTEATTNGAWTGSTLSGGTGARAFTSLGLVPGEFVFIGSDETDTSFAQATDNGFCRVLGIAEDKLTFDKTQFTMVADAGTGKTIRVYFGRVLKNESDPTLIVKRGVQIERTLGAPDDAQPTQIQAEYLVRSLANSMKLDAKTADIIRIDLEFLANTNELRTAAEGLKAGARPTIADTDAFNSTSDVAYTKMALVTAGEAAPSPLFSYFTDLTMEIKNNVKQNKAVSVLGAFDSTPGFFQVQSTVTAYFTDVAEIQAVRDNRTVTLETHFVKFNKGVTLDLPCLTMSKALADVKLNEPIMIPLGADAAAGTAVNTALNHTLLWVFWDYLPDAAN
jgi:hypothetical protein